MEKHEHCEKFGISEQSLINYLLYELINVKSKTTEFKYVKFLSFYITLLNREVLQMYF